MLNGLLINYAIDAVRPVAFWITVTIFSALLTGAIITLFIKKENIVPYMKAAISAFFVYALVIGILLIILDIAKHFDSAYLEENYVDKSVTYYVMLPAVVSLVILLIAALFVEIRHILGKKRIEETRADGILKIINIVLFVIALIAVIVTVVLIGIYYGKRINGDGYYTADGTGFSQAALYTGAALIVALAVALALIFDKSKADFNSKMIARAGISIALSFVLSYVALFKLPQGGTVTLASLLPVMLFAYSYGLKRGIVVGFIYGLMQSLQDPFIIHPAQFLLDYPVAFAMIGTAGLFANVRLPSQLKFAFGAIFAGVLRFVSHVISGVFAFGAYAPAGQDHLLYSLAYNSFVFVDIAIAIAAGVLLLTNKAFARIIEEK